MACSSSQTLSHHPLVLVRLSPQYGYCSINFGNALRLERDVPTAAELAHELAERIQCARLVWGTNVVAHVVSELGEVTMSDLVEKCEDERERLLREDGIEVQLEVGETPFSWVKRALRLLQNEETVAVTEEGGIVKVLDRQCARVKLRAFARL